MPNQISPPALNQREPVQREDVRRTFVAAILPLLAVLIPAFAAYRVLFLQALAAPFQDDYHALLAFGAGYLERPGLSAKVAYVVTFQHNEYKLIFGHLIAACEISLTGRLNFTFLNTLGNLFLLPIGYLLWLIYRERDESLNSALIRFLPVSLLFFSLTYWEAMNWAMASLSTIPVIFFSFLAVYLLVIAPSMRRQWIGIALGCASGLAAGFSLVNGLMLAPVGLLILLPRRAYKSAVAWCITFVVAAAPYFYHYTRIERPLSSVALVSRPIGFLTFIGSAIPSLLFAMLLGLALFIIGAKAIRARFDRRNPAAFYSFLWILLTGFLIGWVRGGSGGALASRYSMYSLLAVIFCLEFLADSLKVRYARFNPKSFYATATIFAVAICIWSDLQAYRKLGDRKEMVLNGLEHYRSNPAVNSPLIDAFTINQVKGEDVSEQLDLTHALESGVYTLPPKSAEW